MNAGLWLGALPLPYLHPEQEGGPNVSRKVALMLVQQQESRTNIIATAQESRTNVSDTAPARSAVRTRATKGAVIGLHNKLFKPVHVQH